MARKRNKFAGADDIYLTKKSVAVRKIATKLDKHGNYRKYDNTKYYPKTKSNINLARKVVGNIRYGR